MYPFYIHCLLWKVQRCDLIFLLSPASAGSVWHMFRFHLLQQIPCKSVLCTDLCRLTEGNRKVSSELPCYRSLSPLAKCILNCETGKLGVMCCLEIKAVAMKVKTLLYFLLSFPTNAVKFCRPSTNSKTLGA